MATTAPLDWKTRGPILGSDPGLALYNQVCEWFDKEHKFRREEDDRMYGNDPTPSDLEIHKRLLQRLISDGEHLLTLIEQSGGLIENKERITKECVEAALESLQLTFRDWHVPNPIPKEERERLLKAIFPDVA